MALSNGSLVQDTTKTAYKSDAQESMVWLQYCRKEKLIPIFSWNEGHHHGDSTLPSMLHQLLIISPFLNPKISATPTQSQFALIVIFFLFNDYNNFFSKFQEKHVW